MNNFIEFALPRLATPRTILVRRMKRTWFGLRTKEVAEETLAPDVPILKLLPIPAGEFKMGSPSSEWGHQANENQVRVIISRPYWLAETQFTQDQWEALMGNNPSRRRAGNLPVENVSWEGCTECLTKLNTKFSGTLPAGYRFALPTEAQWEYACRAGTTTAFHYGIGLDSTLANFGTNYPLFSNKEDILPSDPRWEKKEYGYIEKTTPVKSYPPNAWGLYDMHGNVWEWCEDWYGDKLSGGSDPAGPTVGSGRIVRGGSWDYGDGWCRSAYRAWIAPGESSSRLGFRAALSLIKPSRIG